MWDWDTAPQVPCFYYDLGLPSFLTGNYWRAPFDPVLAMQLINSCVMQAWLLSTSFEDFCGTETAPEDQSLATRAAQGPHSNVHMSLVGGAMGNLMVAAADPVFYAHHANVDRYWSYWLRKYCDLKKPARWLTKPWYFFHDEHRQLVGVQPYQIVDEQVLGYKYNEDSSNWYANFESIPMEPSLLSNPRDLLKKFTRLTAAALSVREREKVTPLEALTSLDAVETAATETPVLLDNALKELADKFGDSLMLPVRLRFTPPAGAIKPGKYYLVQAKRGVSPYNIGGFGVFSHGEHASQTVPEVAVAGCLAPDIVRLFKNQDPKVPLTFVCGEPETDSHAGLGIKHEIPLATVSIEVLSPRGADEAK
ncbi:MAG: tyrosinase family protein [Bryobacteraceae bacterium]